MAMYAQGLSTVEDIFIACVVRQRRGEAIGLKGLPEAIAAVIPKTRVQLCIVHLIRNALRYIPWRSQAEVIADLKPIYQAAMIEKAETALENFADKWDNHYPTISQIWFRHRDNILVFFTALTMHQTFAT
ncbi:Transposase, Mutator family [Leptolyngbya sp. O-77]|nr:Transposase, Mutator family [Leptolyngbya sp. O-77]